MAFKDSQKILVSNALLATNLNWVSCLRFSSVGFVTSDEWLGRVKQNVKACMGPCEDGRIEFAMLSLVREPLLRHVQSLSSNIKAIQTISTHLDLLRHDGHNCAPRLHDSTSGSTLIGPDTGYEIDEECIDNAVINPTINHLIQAGDVVGLRTCRQQYVMDQIALRATVQEEQENKWHDQVKAMEKLHEYGSALRLWLEFHARQRVLSRC